MKSSISSWIVNRFFRAEIQKAINEQSEQVKRLQRRDDVNRGLINNYQQGAPDNEGQISMTDPHELLDRYAVQAGLRAPVDKVAKIVGTCVACIGLRKGYEEVPEQRAYLEDLIDHPDGTLPFSTVLFEVVVRLKVLGECAWEWIYPDSASVDAGRRTAVKAVMSAMIQDERLRCKGLEPPVERIKAIASKADAIVGEVVTRTKERPIGFRVLQGIVNPIVDKHGEFINEDRAFVQIVNNGDRAYFSKQDVLWMRGPNPLGGSHALAPFESLRFIDDIDQKVQVYMHSLLENRGELGGIVTLKNPAAGEVERVYNELENRHSGPENAGKWHVIAVEADGDTKVERFAVRPMEVEEENSAVRRLRLMWSVLNVPGGKVGFINDVNRANIEMQDKALLEEEVGPLCTMVADPFNQFIQVVLGMPGYYLKFAPADLRTETDRLEIQRKKFNLGQLTLNEMIKELYGEEELVKDGDIRVINLEEGILIFSKDKPAHVMSSSGAVLPLYSDTSTPGPEVVTDPRQPRRRPLGPDVEVEVEVDSEEATTS